MRKGDDVAASDVGAPTWSRAGGPAQSVEVARAAAWAR
jgi:hypothetical protein